MTSTALQKDTEATEQLGVLRELMTSAEILPSQLPSPSHWSAELRLAAAVLVQAMADIRLRDGRDHIAVSSALCWVRANDSTWPLSFLRVCELLQLDPAWVRQSVNRWLRRGAHRRNSMYRNAA